MALSVDIRKTMGKFILDVRFDAENEALALLGSSGCGKSVTLKCVAGILKPDEGSIVLDGRLLFDSKKKINLPPQERRVGLLFQNYALFPNMTVVDNILSGMKNERGEDRRRRLNSLIDRFYLQGLESHYPAQLSGGQQQRTALARILASKPSLVMLDEPLSALDSFLRWHLEMELARLLEQFEGTTLYVSHNRSEVYRLCKKVCVMHQGRSEPVRDVAGLFAEPGTLTAALLSGCKNYSRATRIDERSVFALDWGVTLLCETLVPEDISFVGVRAHYFTISDEPGDRNTLDCTTTRVVEDVFGSIVMARSTTAKSTHENSHIRIETSKERVRRLRPGERIFVRAHPKDVMPLRK